MDREQAAELIALQKEMLTHVMRLVIAVTELRNVMIDADDEDQDQANEEL